MRFLPGLRSFALPVLLTALGAACGTCAWAENVSELINKVNASLTPEELAEPGSTTRAAAISALLSGGLKLTPEETAELSIAAAEAWLDAGKVDEAKTRLTAVLSAGATLSPALRERAGLAYVATWRLGWSQALHPESEPDIATVIKPFGDLGVQVAAAVEVAEGRRQMAVKHLDRVLAHYDAALALLAALPAEQRVPIYVLRMDAMEALKQKPEAVQAWLTAHNSDPAIAQVADSAMTAGQKMLGKAAPPLVLKRIDGTPGQIDLTGYHGKTVLIDFFATWCKPCEGIAPAIEAASARLAAKGLITIGVSLDNQDTLKNLPAWIARFGVTYPVIGEGLGWDGETDKAWHVDAIPALIMIGPDGRIIANDLVGGSLEATERNIEDAFAGKPVSASSDGPAPGEDPADTQPAADGPPGSDPPAPGEQHPAVTPPGFVP